MSVIEIEYFMLTSGKFTIEKISIYNSTSIIKRIFSKVKFIMKILWLGKNFKLRYSYVLFSECWSSNRKSFTGTVFVEELFQGHDRKKN